MKKPVIFLGVLLVVITIVIVAGTIIVQKKSKSQKIAMRKTTIGVSATSLLPSLVYIAKEKGYSTGKDALAAVLKGKIDMRTVAGPPVVKKALNSKIRSSVLLPLQRSSLKKILASTFSDSTGYLTKNSPCTGVHFWNY